MAKKRNVAGEGVDEIPEIRRRRIVLPVKCGDCVFHKRLATYPRPCFELGTPPSADTCIRFAPDPSHMGDATDLATTLKALASAQRPALAAMAMLGARAVERLGFSIGQTVYMKVLGGDFLCNYARAVVVAASRDKLVLAGAQGYTALVGTDLLLNYDSWAEKRQRLVRAKRINDPSGGLRKLDVRGSERLIVYEPNQIGGGKRKKPRGRPKRKNGPITLNPID